MTAKGALKVHARTDPIPVDPRRLTSVGTAVELGQLETDRRAEHRVYALPLTLIAIGVQWELALSLPAQIAIMTAVVALLGVPHGALDDLLALPYLPARWGLVRLPAFIGAYLSVAALVIGVWMLAPVPSLMAFLALSVIHFGSGDVPPDTEGAAKLNSVASRGFLPILLPPLLHPAPVAEIFGWLVGGPIAAASVSQVALVVLPFAFVTWAAEVWRMIGSRGGIFEARSELSELGVLALLFALTPPLFSFAIYFGFWHSARHILEIAARLPQKQNQNTVVTFVTLAAPLTVATLLMAGAALVGLTLSGVELPQGTATVVFIGLAALTVPHMILTAMNQEGDLERRPAVLSS